METQDYLMKQIAQLGYVLSRLLSDLLKLQNIENKAAIALQIEQELKDKADISFSELLNYSFVELLAYLKNREDFDMSNLEKLGDILLYYAQNLQEGNPAQQLKKCLALYRHIDSLSQTFAPERHQKINEIENLLQS